MEEFKKDFLWYVGEIRNDRSTTGKIKEAVWYYDSLSDEDKESFIQKAYELSAISMYHAIVQTAEACY